MQEEIELVEIDHFGFPEFVRRDVVEAIDIAKRNMPPYPEAILKKCECFDSRHGKSVVKWQKQGKADFRGWTFVIGKYHEALLPNNISVVLGTNGYMPEEDCDLTVGYTGLWRCRTANVKTPIAWCSVPSLNHGMIAHGESFNPGDRFLRLTDSIDFMEEKLLEGFEIISRLVAENGEYIPEGSNG